MHERFSDRARHAMALANLEASKLKHDYLAPAHLMLGLIAEGACVATATLRVLDVDIEKIRRDVRERMKEGDGQAAFGGRTQTTALKETISFAIGEARKFGHRYVGTEHLILGLLACAEGIPFQVLRREGLDLDTVREKALAMLRSPADAAQDLTHSRHGDFEWVHQQELAKAFRSPKYWHTLILAVDSANRLGAGEVEPVHLLLALLRDPDNGIAAMLAEKGITADWLREKIAEADQ